MLSLSERDGVGNDGLREAVTLWDVDPDVDADELSVAECVSSWVLVPDGVPMLTDGDVVGGSVPVWIVFVRDFDPELLADSV
mmetsp:Transcript_37290/g.115142  ORF Transcript_37290/g.115142 Transcript_37290/m.115142 type:complete len:82 (+) Transcript_37290:252-497(+)